MPQSFFAIKQGLNNLMICRLFNSIIIQIKFFNIKILRLVQELDDVIDKY